ncbi:MAG: hypothetical protein K9N55_15680 [Phycisphaerae bacterium]|nr:hypothetical protein [Phycisphaerae bacterium]
MDVKQCRFLGPGLVVCLLFFSACSGAVSVTPAMAPVTQVETSVPKLTLLYQVGQRTTYCLSSEVTRSVQFEGIRPDDETLGVYASAVTGALTDVTWCQTVQGVDPNGQSLLRIELNGLTYKAYRAGELVVDYDSTRDENETTALEDVPGLTYEVRVDARGHVVQVMGQDEALAGLDKDKPHFTSARRLVSKEVIQARHSIEALHGAPDRAVKDAAWSTRQSFAFGQLGGKQFNKTYTCLGTTQGSSLVEIRMAGILTLDKSLSSVTSKTLPFSSEDQYAGTLILETRTGQVKTYHETLAVDWTFVDPASMKEAEPRKGHMTARQAFLLERKDVPQ